MQGVHNALRQLYVLGDEPKMEGPAYLTPQPVASASNGVWEGETDTLDTERVFGTIGPLREPLPVSWCTS